MQNNIWIKKPLTWIHNRVFYISIPFTWNLPGVRAELKQRSFLWDCAVVGGPAVELMPDYFNDLDHVANGLPYPGMLQLFNPYATRTTTGCLRSCKFCAVPRLEGDFKELEAWPDLPVLIDNNLLASSIEHFDKVIDRLVRWQWADFNQGLDARLLITYHARRLSEIKKPTIRIALDDQKSKDAWARAFDKLIKAGIAKTNIKSFALIAFDTGPDEAWDRCKWIEGHGIKASPTWFHSLDTLKQGIVSKEQERLGWSDYERRRIMQWFYKHKKAKGE